jgi:hypothetical protein
MRLAIVCLAIVVLAGCDYLPMPGGSGAAGPDVTARRAEFVAVVEAAGCRLDQSENEAVLVPAGFSDAEAGALGGLLVAEGAAELSTPEGDLILLTENCV